MHIRKQTIRLWQGVGAMALTLLAGCGAPDGPMAIPATEIAAIQTSPPEYPMELACDDVGGQVILKVTVGPDGSPSAIVVDKSSRAPALDAAAAEAVRGWQFRAATRNGQPIEQTIQVPVTFTPPDMRPDACFAMDERNRTQL